MFREGKPWMSVAHLDRRSFLKSGGLFVVAFSLPMGVAAAADFAAVPDFYLILSDQPGANSWPITAATYILLRRDSGKEANTRVVKFIHWCMTEGQKEARDLNYVPLPDRTLRWIKAYWKSQIGIEL